MSDIHVAALYQFAPLDDYAELRQPLLDECRRLGIFGSLLLASEGINGTIAGAPDAIVEIIGWLRRDPRLTALPYKLSTASEMPFKRMKVKLKKEIVTLGVPGVDPNKRVGTYVKPADWNALLADPDVVVIDTRNDYEVEIGTFERAIDPKITTFRHFPEFVAQAEVLKDKPKVAMFCTGGIRCEKASSLMLELGFPEVFHLEGGILKYLEEVPEAESLWKGACFVFDERVALEHGLEESRLARDPKTGRVLD